MHKVEIRSGISIIAKVMNYLAHIKEKIKRSKREKTKKKFRESIGLHKFNFFLEVL